MPYRKTPIRNTAPGRAKKAALYTAAGLFFITVLYACAHVVSPTGGPRDEDPPEMIRSTPPNFSTNFEGGRVRMFFDEFIELRNIRQQLLVSPPLEHTPEISVRGRSIVMDIEEELRPNTTYNFFFGDAVRDITEGNAIPNFQFVFSTGDYVDSLAIRGSVRNAFNLQPEHGVYVMLYDNVYDSVPYLERPVYLAKTDKNGHFTISNMAGGEYLIFALDDKNNNFKYDPYEERIAFLDSLVRPVYIPQFVDPDTIPAYYDANDANGGIHTITVPGPDDELFVHARDSQPAAAAADIPEYRLFMFQEKDTVQRILSSSLVHRGLIEVAFRVPFDSAYVREIRAPFGKGWHIPEFTEKRDTLRIWYTDTGRDTLFLEVRDAGTVIDTIRRATTPRRVREADEETPDPLSISLNISRPSAVPFFRPLAITADRPVEAIDTTRIEMMDQDSVPVYPQFRFDDHVRRKMEMHPLFDEETTYFLTILPGAFTDIFGRTNDTLAMRLATTSRENYGSLILNIRSADFPNQGILQLLSQNETVLQEKIIHQEGRYAFRHIRPGFYLVRLVEDLHRSGQWDTGHYLRQVQPEPVHMLPDTVRIRENWDVEMEWSVNGPL